MNERNRTPWLRISAEGATIIASILFAFAIDAWWNGVQADRDTQEMLEAVLFEMEANLDSLQDSIAHHAEIVAAINIVQEQKSISGLLEAAVIDVEVFEPSEGALDTLIATGMLSEINDRALQISLGAFAAYTNDLRDREFRAVDFRDAARRRIAAIGVPIWDRPDTDRINMDVHMLNLLTMRQAEEQAAIESAQRLERHLRVLLSQLDPVR